MNWLLNLFGAIASPIVNLFTAKQQTKTVQAQTVDDTVLRDTDQINLQNTQASITQTVVANHEFFANLGIGLIWFSCGFRVFNDLVVVTAMSWFHVTLHCMTTPEVMQLISIMLGNGALHVAKNWVKG